METFKRPVKTGKTPEGYKYLETPRTLVDVQTGVVFIKYKPVNQGGQHG